MYALALVALLISCLGTLVADATSVSSLHRHLQARHAADAAAVTDAVSSQSLTAGLVTLGQLAGNVNSTNYELVLTLQSASGSNPDSLPTNATLPLYVTLPPLANGTYRYSVSGTNLTGTLNYTYTSVNPDQTSPDGNFTLGGLVIPSLNISGVAVPEFNSSLFIDLPEQCYPALDQLTSYYSSIFELMAASYTQALTGLAGDSGGLSGIISSVLGGLTGANVPNVPGATISAANAAAIASAQAEAQAAIDAANGNTPP